MRPHRTLTKLTNISGRTHPRSRIRTSLGAYDPQVTALPPSILSEGTTAQASCTLVRWRGAHLKARNCAQCARSRRHVRRTSARKSVLCRPQGEGDGAPPGDNATTCSKLHMWMWSHAIPLILQTEQFAHVHTQGIAERPRRRARHPSTNSTRAPRPVRYPPCSTKSLYTYPNQKVWRRTLDIDCPIPPPTSDQ